MKIHPDTIHFDDKPWSVRGYIYDGSSRFMFTVPEDLIFERTGKTVLECSDMINWVKENIDGIEKYCANHVKRRNAAERPLNNGDEIIVLKV